MRRRMHLVYGPILRLGNLLHSRSALLIARFDEWMEWYSLRVAATSSSPSSPATGPWWRATGRWFLRPRPPPPANRRADTEDRKRKKEEKVWKQGLLDFVGCLVFLSIYSISGGRSETGRPDEWSPISWKWRPKHSFFCLFWGQLLAATFAGIWKSFNSLSANYNQGSAKWKEAVVTLDYECSGRRRSFRNPDWQLGDINHVSWERLSTNLQDCLQN